MRTALVLLVGLVLGGCSSSSVNDGAGGATSGDASSGGGTGGGSGAVGTGGSAGASACTDLGGGILGNDGSVEMGLGQWYANDGLLEHEQAVAACGVKSIRIHTSAPEAPSARYPVSAAAVVGKTYSLSFCLRSNGIGRDVTVDTFSDGGVGASVTVHAAANAWTHHTVPSMAFPPGESPHLRFVVQPSANGSEALIDCVNLIEV